MELHTHPTRHAVTNPHYFFANPNGVIVADPDGTQTDLPPGGRAVLNAGSRVLLGGLVIDVLHE